MTDLRKTLTLDAGTIVGACTGTNLRIRRDTSGVGINEGAELRLLRVCQLAALSAIAALVGCGSSESISSKAGDALSALGAFRPSNASCIAPDRPASTFSVSLRREFPNLLFDDPVGLLQAPGDSSRWFVVERRGRIRVFPNDPGVTQDQVVTFLDLTSQMPSATVFNDWEAGLLGMAFHPEFVSNGRFFVHYTGMSETPDYTVGIRISEFKSTDGSSADLETERELIVAYKGVSYHNGGQLAFGPDGYLYATLGDGGSGLNSLTLTNLFGKVLRINVDEGDPYSVPAANPFAGGALCRISHTPENSSVPRTVACPEIYAYGLRNPWRFSFDRGGGQADLWVADVGHSSFEEINLLATPGGNYGWGIREGKSCVTGPECPSEVDGVPMIDPVHAIPHPEMNAIVGGFVYRGSELSELQGNYIFGNFAPGVVYALFPNSAGGFERQQLAVTDLQISSFAEDATGEVYVVDLAGGVYRLTQSEGGVGTIPDSLVDTGCVDPANPTLPAAGLVPYVPNASFWSGDTDKERWVALPDGSSITVESDGDWSFPVGTVLMKHFRFESRLIETRLMMRHTDGDWAGYTYQWNDSQTEAKRVRGGTTQTIGELTWRFPSEAECLRCHTKAAGGSLGLETSQLKGNQPYSHLGITADQITIFKLLGFLSGPAADTSTVLALPNPYDPSSGDLASRARAYLHVNCSQCHRPGGGTAVNLDLRFDTPISSMNACNVTATQGDLGQDGAKRIAPGEPEKSLIYLRMNRVDAYAMPPIGIGVIDTDGVALIGSWIEQMDASCRG